MSHAFYLYGISWKAQRITLRDILQKQNAWRIPGKDVLMSIFVLLSFNRTNPPMHNFSNSRKYEATGKRNNTIKTKAQTTLWFHSIYSPILRRHPLLKFFGRFSVFLFFADRSRQRKYQVRGIVRGFQWTLTTVYNPPQQTCCRSFVPRS